MKKIMILVSFFFVSVSTSMATDVIALNSPKVIAEYRYGKMETREESANGDDIYVLTIVTAQVTEAKILKIKEESVVSSNRWGPSSENETRKVEVRSTKLNDEVFSLIKSDADFLADAKIKTTKQNVICMMMPVWGQSNDHLSVLKLNNDNNLKELTLVDGPRGCWLSEQTHPVPEYAAQTALMLKRTLKVLSL